MEYSKDYYNTHGVTKLVEYVSDDQTTLLEWYKNDHKIDFLDSLETSNRYPFYKISYLTKVMIDPSGREEGKEYFDLSAKYLGLRSVVLCNGDIEPLNETDKKILETTSKHINWPNIFDYYSSKMLIEEDGIKYTMFIQNGLENLIPRDIETIIRYYTIGYNGKLYLTMVNVLH